LPYPTPYSKSNITYGEATGDILWTTDECQSELKKIIRPCARDDFDNIFKNFDFLTNTVTHNRFDSV